jgi:hypothetical protein
MLIDPFGRCAGALEVHARLPVGRRFCLAAAVPDPDEAVVSTAAVRAAEAHARVAEHAARLGMTQREYRRQRVAGKLPAWCYEGPRRGRRPGARP